LGKTEERPNFDDKMKKFTKSEVRAVGVILLGIFVLSFFNFRVSLRRARDSQRKSDIGSIYEALNNYFQDFGQFPLSSADGKIIACKGPETKLDPLTGVVINLVPCGWGQDALRDVMDLEYPEYLKALPADIHAKKGATYLYLSTGSRYQLYAALEGKTEAEYDVKIVARNLKCGLRICNFGKASGNTPLDKSIEEYENELAKQKK
jgi:hypothetical protein